MVVAGIDEAGYGPLLGPLVVGGCAFELEGQAGDDLAELPCLWKRLSRVVSKSRPRRSTRLHVNDSKLVYSPAAGLKELERSVLALAGAMADGPCCLDGLLGTVAEHVVAELGQYPWYAAAAGEAFPLAQESAAVRVMANALRQELERAAVRCVYLRARVLPERQLNRQFEQTRNKSSVLFSAAAVHLEHLLRQFGSRGLVVICDQQGGRAHYGRLLRLMFDDWSLEVIREDEGYSEYALVRDQQRARLVFREKAEAQCLPVAWASMLCKYLREALMQRFNAWWSGRLPGLVPTAGYYSDGQRFLADIAAKRQELGIADADLVRSR